MLLWLWRTGYTYEVLAKWANCSVPVMRRAVRYAKFRDEKRMKRISETAYKLR